MCMNLDFLFGYQNSAKATGAPNQAPNMFQPTGPPADMTSFKAGQTIQGEVVATRNNEVIIQLDDGSQINARLTKDININIGQTMTFEVKSNNGARLSLSPLFENMGHDPNVLKALNAAGLPESARNLEMVSLLMRQGLPVDKNFLLSFSRQMTMNPTTDPVTLAQLNRMDIPITKENIQQFEAYRNYEHQISAAVREITDGLIRDIGQMVVKGETDSAVALFKQVLGIFNADNTANKNMNSLFQPQNPVMITGDGIVRIISEQTNMDNQAVTTMQNTSQAQSLPNLSVLTTPPSEMANPEQQLLSQTDVANQTAVANQAGVADQAGVSSQTTTPVVITDTTFISLMELPPENREQLAILLREAGFSQTLTDAVNNPLTNQATLASLIEQEINQNPGLFDNAKLAGLLSNRDFQALIKNDINNQWLLKPEDVARERHVEEFFNKVFAQTTKLLESLNNAGRGDTAVAQSAANLGNNLSFVNQLNQVFTYIQLPLSMNGENTHAELYVYTNKKNLAKKDGNVSALLHLDMEFLGPLDVYISMQNHNVTTKFYLASEKIIDFVAKHIHILEERLKERGYAMNSEFVTRVPEKKPIDEIIEATKNISILATYSFDARA